MSSNRNAEQLRERAWRSTPKKKLWRCLISHRASANSLRTIQAIPTRRSKRVWVGRLQRSIDLPTGGGCSCLHLNGARKPSIARRTASRKVCGLFTLLCGPSSDRRCLDVCLSVPTPRRSRRRRRPTRCWLLRLGKSPEADSIIEVLRRSTDLYQTMETKWGLTTLNRRCVPTSCWCQTAGCSPTNASTIKLQAFCSGSYSSRGRSTRLWVRASRLFGCAWTWAREIAGGFDAWGVARFGVGLEFSE